MFDLNPFFTVVIHTRPSIHISDEKGKVVSARSKNSDDTPTRRKENKGSDDEVVESPTQKSGHSRLYSSNSILNKLLARRSVVAIPSSESELFIFFSFSYSSKNY